LNHNRQHRNSVFLALAILYCGVGPSWALDGKVSASDYSRQQWSAEDGFRIGQVSSIAQTPDGYLWLGGENGLVSFDGEKFRAFPTSGQLGITHVLGLAIDGQGALWVWMPGPNVLRYSQAGFINVTNQLRLSDEITVLSSGTQGGLLISTVAQEIFEYHDGQIRQIGSAESSTLCLFETQDGRVWVGTRDYALAYVESGRVIPVAGKTAQKKINCLLGHGKKALWVGTDEGLFLWTGSSLERVPGPVGFSRTQVVSIVEDRDGNLWCGTDKGLYRVSEDVRRQQTASGPFLSQSITALFEDREGGLWIGAAGTLQRWKDPAFQPIESDSNRQASFDAPIYVDEQNTAWVASQNGGLYRVKESGVERCRPDVFGNDVVYSLTGQNGDIWAGRRGGGLTHLHPTSGGVAAATFTTADGLAQNIVVSVFKARTGTVWAGTLNGGLSRLQNGNWTTFTTANGLPSNAISTISEDSEGLLWIGTPDGLASLSGEQWRVYTVRDGLPSNDVSVTLPDADGGDRILWVGTVKGLALLRSGSIRTIDLGSDVSHEPIWGLTKDFAGYLWVSTPDHLARIRRDRLLRESPGPRNVRLYGRLDGIEQPGGLRRMRCLETDTTGRVWAGTKGGLRVTTSAYMRHPAVSTIVNLESIITDGGAVAVRSPRIPQPQRRIVFDYTGLNFAAPDHIRFRYRLDGYDKDWSNPVASRQVAYTHLDPGAYRFRVIASNEEGEWNSTEADASILIEPAVWQTWWFRSICFLAAALLFWCAYTFRMHQVAAQNSLILEGRVAERTRIARELHDTMLQSFQAALMKFHAVTYLLDRPAEAQKRLESAIQEARNAITEGRDAVQGLRSSTVVTNDLARAITTVGEQLAAHQTGENPTEFRLAVEGATRDIVPLVRDEVNRIACEAVRNAFQHAHATRIEVEIHYDKRQFRLRVRDDGKGIDLEVLGAGGRAGHHGLPGMQERAHLTGGKLAVCSEPESGTEIELTIPAANAYAKSPAARQSMTSGEAS
jgi:ligand-binding sensor domain-containing protein/signal transduction histidine kinase